MRATAAYRKTVAPTCWKRRSWKSPARRADPDRSAPCRRMTARRSRRAATAVVHKPLPHDSARLHVQGAATYVDDIREPAGTLHVAIGMANKASGRLKSLDLDAVRGAPGVVAVLTAADIPGKNDIAPVFADEPLVRRATKSCSTARPCSRSSREPRPGPPGGAARQHRHRGRGAGGHDRRRACSGARVQEDYSFGRGDAAAAIDKAARRLEGEFAIGGQEHFYLEGQVSFAFPGEGDEMTVHASTQDPTETQHIVSRILGIPDAFVTVETRRMGGGFGGKESQACAWAAIAALGARVTGTLQGSARSRRRLRTHRQAPRFPGRLAGRLRRQGRRRRL